MLLGKNNAAITGLPDVRVNGVTHDHAEQDRQR